MKTQKQFRGTLSDVTSVTHTHTHTHTNTQVNQRYSA